MLFKSTGIKTGRLISVLLLVMFLAACATGAIREKMLSMPQVDGASYVGQDTCLECHDDMAGEDFPASTGGEGFAKTIHGRLADFEMMGAEKGCESCHGPGSLHVDAEGDPDSILRPAELAAEEVGAICASCHTDGSLMDWTHSEHALADLSCTDCHSIHGENHAKASLKQDDPELCYSCHQEMQAKSNFPSHHPIKEGKMSCGDCHNPHGELNTHERTNDLCLDCHSRYQGPFIFGHAPVEDDCTICHDPHGSVANNLLVQNEPFLCLQCHEGHFHLLRQASSYDDGDDSVLSATEAANPHGTEGFQMSFGTKCTTCHAVVHGSDSPSQPLTGGGLTR
ncbi:GSU2203 family decaheme c-type cytochrome [uncultured Desulfuromusa sp.]|uniref:GSU2203 family decaheme c-type cytochrome n=1 Tax=uncultured Desulfuromusa sp. TaxID=219183 RepID=UPI002AA86281|nr:GSU2203 family decaheme c-type cytochrome [uncultured Desulfuromusa sp.]